MTRKSAFGLVLTLTLGLALTGSIFSQEAPRSDLSPAGALAYTVPAVVLNTVPGFGLGSYAQGDIGRGVRLSILDGVGAGLVGVGLYGLALYPDPDEGGLAALSLLAGYGVLAVGKTVGVLGPIIHARDHGVDPDALFPPIFYNSLLGFGVGSLLQGDREGATLVALFDGVALFSVGVLSFAALAGGEIVSGVAGMTAIGSYFTARTLGVIRPIRYRNRRAREHAPPEGYGSGEIERFPMGEEHRPLRFDGPGL
jgi:hypothetical protein